MVVVHHSRGRDEERQRRRHEAGEDCGASHVDAVQPQRPPEPRGEEPKEGNFVLRSLSADSARGEGVEVGARSSVKKSCIGPHCRIGANVKITNCVLFDHVVIGDKVTMQNVIIGGNAEVREGASLKDAQVAIGMRVEANAVVKGEAIAEDHEEED